MTEGFMTASSAQQAPNVGAVRWWLIVVAVLIAVMVLVGGATRLTEAGLSIVEWKPVTGTLRRMTARPQPVVPVLLKVSGVALLGLTFVQLYFGALVAGLRAGRVYNTWPEIDGALIPSAARLWFETPWWRNLFDNTLTVQFEHRMTAYALLILALLHAIDAVRSKAGAATVNGALALVAA